MALRNKRYADDGWAVWIDGEDVSTVYFNCWLNPKKKSYIDVAVRVRGIKETRKLNIYVPFVISKEEVEDISLKLNNKEILRAIFGVGCLLEQGKNFCTSEIAYNGKTIDLVHVSKIDFEVCDIASGSMITIDFVPILSYIDNDEAYFTVRLPLKSMQNVFSKRIDAKSALGRLTDLISTPVINEEYGYSLRVNEASLLPSEITAIGSFNRQRLKKAVVTISIDDNYDVNDANCYRIRRVEQHVYDGYAPEGFSSDTIILYEWNQSRERRLRGYFNFYTEIERHIVSKKSMLFYMTIVLIVGAMGNALWELLKFLVGLIGG